MITDYDYLAAHSMTELSVKVREFMQEHRSWQPWGGPFAVLYPENKKFEQATDFYQAMVKMDQRSYGRDRRPTVQSI